jgi:hypothetical protein
MAHRQGWHPNVHKEGRDTPIQKSAKHGENVTNLLILNKNFPAGMAQNHTQSTV